MSSAPQFTAQLGGPLPLAYGPAWVRGKPVIPHIKTDKTRIVFYILGEGEWNALKELWINRVLVDPTDTTKVHFHPGRDGLLGNGLTPESTGGNNRVDAFWSELPAGLQPMTFSRKAYLAVKVPPDPGAPSEELDVIGEYETMKVRIFNASGTQTSYAYTTNYAWMILDMIIRTHIKREYNITDGGVIDELTADEKARIDFASFKDAADYNDEVISGHKRWEGGVNYPQRVTETESLEQMLIVSRSYLIEYGGKIYLYSHKARAATFTLKAKHVKASSFSVDKKELGGARNLYQGHFNDTKRAKVADTETPGNTGLSRTSNVVTWKGKTDHGLQVDDQVYHKAADDSSFDGGPFKVIEIVDPNELKWTQAGANGTSGNGRLEMAGSKFGARMHPVPHKEHQLHVGQRGLAPSTSGVLPVMINPKPLDIRMGNNTMGQVERALKFQAYSRLGNDASPYKAPRVGRVRCWRYAVDDANNALLAQNPGDVIHVDADVSEEFQGDYILREPTTILPGEGDGEDAEAVIDLLLDEYVSAAFTDTEGSEQLLQPLAVRRGLGVPLGPNVGAVGPFSFVSFGPSSGAMGIRETWVEIKRFLDNIGEITVAASSAASAPSAPTLGEVSGGALGARTRYVRVAYVKEKTMFHISAESNFAVSANNLLKVTSPTAVPGYDGWIPLVGSVTNEERQQSDALPATPVPFGADWTEPSAGANVTTGTKYSDDNASLGAHFWDLPTSVTRYLYSSYDLYQGKVEFSGGILTAKNAQQAARADRGGHMALSDEALTVSTPAAGGGGSGSGGGGGGGGGCPALEMWLNESTRVRDAKVGDLVDVLEDDGAVVQLPILSIEYSTQECCELKTEHGLVVVSVTTPCTTRYGKSVSAWNTHGEELAAIVGSGNELQVLWGKVEVRYIGLREVARVYVGGRVFAAGGTPGRRLFTHNLEK